MNYNYLLLGVIILCVAAAAFKIGNIRAENLKMEAAAVIDKFLSEKGNKNSGGADLDNDGQMLAAQNNPLGAPRISSDGSEINAMVDRYGNRTETRCFDYHPRLNCIMVNTSAQGQRRAFVYGQNGDVRDLPEEMMDQALSATADEIADAAQIVITQQRPATPFFAPVSQPQKVVSSQATRNSQTQPQGQAIESAKVSGTQTGTGNAEAAASQNNPQPYSESGVLNNRPPEDK